MASKKPRASVSIEDILPDVIPDVIRESNVSTIDAMEWYNEVALVMEGKFSTGFIVKKAKLAFGQQFDESRFNDDTEDSLKNRILGVWDSQK